MKPKHKKNLLTIACLLVAWNITVQADILTDGTVGDIYYLFGDNMIIPESYGTRVGDNLFHSFAMFNIYSGEAVTFTGSNTLQNVIARVTGGDVSTISGILSSNIGKANFYFINPAGVTFGKNAVVDVPAAFHVSTANQINFADGSVYSATNPAASTLTIAKPESFGFLGQTGDIVLDGAQIIAKENQTIDLVANNITLKNGSDLYAPAGEVRLVAVKGSQNVSLVRDENGFLPLPNQTPNAENAGDIVIDNSIVDTSGNSGGRVALWANYASFTNHTNFNANNDGDLNATAGKGLEIVAQGMTVDNSWITTNAFGDGNAANLFINVGGKLTVVNNGSISSSAFGRNHAFTKGNAGTVEIKAGDILVDGQGAEPKDFAMISSDTYKDDHGSYGNAGKVKIQSNTLTVAHGGQISSNSLSHGQAGTVEINASDINVQDVGLIMSDTYHSNANAGIVKITADKLSLRNGGLILSNTHTEGSGGYIDINAKEILVTGKSQKNDASAISADSFSPGNAGSIRIQGQRLTVSDEGQISANAHAQGTAGAININVSDISLNNSGLILSQNFGSSGGAAGLINIQADKLWLTYGGLISTSGNEENKAGKAGDIIINANNILVDGQGKFSAILNDSYGSGNAGTTKIYGKNLTVTNTGQISSIAHSSGNGGHITIDMTGEVNINNAGLIDTETFGAGDAGNITIKANKLSLTENGLVISETKPQAQGQAGDIVINAENILIDNSAISSDTYSVLGKAGSVSVSATGTMNLNQGFISSDTHSVGNAGVVTINAGTLNIQNNGAISSDTSSVGKAGNVTVNAGTLNLNHGFISSDTYSSGKAGTVTVNAGELNIQNFGAISSGTEIGSTGHAGNMTVTANTIKMDTGFIASDTYGLGNAGHVTVNAGTLDMRNESSISSNAEPNSIGNAGNVNVNAANISLMNNSSISTFSAETAGQGGDININAGNYVYLEDSWIKTTTDSENANGGDININAGVLVMNTGLIQANAVGGRGGDIRLNLQALIPSFNSLIWGGEPVPWQPYVPGFNVIQAASATGTNGNVTMDYRQSDVSSSISGLKTKPLITPDINRDPCENVTASSLKRSGKGGLPVNEAQTGFIPPVTKLPTSSNVPISEEPQDTLQNPVNQPCKATTI